MASREILAEVAERMRAAGYRVENLDATLIAQVPRLAPYQAEMEKNLVAILETRPERVNLKLTSTDRLGAIGREEGIAGLAVVLLAPVGERGASSSHEVGGSAAGEEA